MNKDMHKFRVYCEFANGNKGYVYFDLAEGLKAALVDIGCDFATTRFLSEVEQCTGLEDKHGVLIFEKDILRDKDGYICYVVWSGVSWLVESPGSLAQDLEQPEFYRGVEIIGNINYTPELLEGIKDDRDDKQGF